MLSINKKFFVSKRINEVIMPILSFIINKNVIFVSVINRN
jgi:hypothetical protein